MPYPVQGLQNLDFSGGLAGVFGAQQQSDAEAQRAALLQNQGLQNTYQQLQNERYGQMTPPEVQRAQGLAQTAQAQGAMDQATMQSNIDAKISDNLSRMSKNDYEKYMTGLNKEYTQLKEYKTKYMNASPGEKLTVLKEAADNFGVDISDPRMVQAMQAAGGPEKIFDSYINAFEMMLTRTPELAQKLQIEDRKGQWDVRRQEVANQGHIAAARIGADARAAAPPKPLNENQLLAQIEQVLADPSASPEEKQRATEIRASIIQRKQQTNPQMGRPGVNLQEMGIPTTTPQQQLNQGMPGAAAPGGGLEAAIRAELERRARLNK